MRRHMIMHVDGFIFLTVGYAGDHFYMLAYVTLRCFAAPSYIQICKRRYILGTSSFLFVTPKTSFVQVCISIN